MLFSDYQISQYVVKCTRVNLFPCKWAPSARIIVEGSCHLGYMQDRPAHSCLAWLQSKMVGDNDKSVVLGVLLSLLWLATAFQHQFAIIFIQLDIWNSNSERWFSTLGLVFRKQLWPCTLHIFNINVFFVGHRCSKFWSFELLVDKCKDLAMLFLTTRPQGHLWFQDGGWANWTSWGCLHEGWIILVPGSSFLSDRIILTEGWS